MKAKPSVYLFVFTAIVYFALVMLIPASQETLDRFNITPTQVRLLNLTVVIPLITIWFIALAGFMRFRDYASVIGESNEGEPYSILANGLMVLAFGLPLNSILSVSVGYFDVNYPHLFEEATVIKNYVNLAFALVAFGMLARGAQLLIMSGRLKKDRHLALPNFIAPVLIVFTSLYTWLVVSRPLHEDNGYFLPNWLIVTTLVIPYIMAWLGGILATYFLNLYRTKVKGSIYKQAFGDLAKGISVVTLISVLLQFFSTISAQLNRLHLTPILLILYMLLLLYAVGFFFIARGAKKLTKIEEV